MKKFTIFLLLISFTFVSCEVSENIPDEVIIESSGELDNLVRSIQIDFAKFIETTGETGARLTRIEYMFGESYDITFDELYAHTMYPKTWKIAYTDLLPVMHLAEGYANEEAANKHLGIIKILKAYTLMTLVDFYGNVPYSEILEPNPSLDDGASIYAAALALLDDAIVNLGQNGVNLEFDFYYNNDFSKWIKLANTLKMNIYVNTRLVDLDAFSKFQTIVNSGNFIDNTNTDFQFQYSPGDLAHPDYTKNYNPTGSGTYRSNWLMDEMVKLNDPRRRFFFYRQISCTPGNEDSNGNYCPVSLPLLSCSGESRPNHYTPFMTFCSVRGGYWGRDHGNFEGVPPDSFRRSNVGLYPAGGRFDDDTFEHNASGQGAKGAGITPIMLASWVDLLRAEMYLANNETGIARNYITQSLQKSMSKIFDFIPLDPDADISFIPSSTEVSTYINIFIGRFNSADINTKWNILAVEFLKAHYGNGINAYNFYKRTGYPNSLQYAINPTPGPFVRSLMYPAEVVNNNINIDQKPNLAVQVFWDINPAYPVFPYSN